MPPAKQTRPSLRGRVLCLGQPISLSSGLSQAGLIPFPVLCRGTSPVSGRGSALRGASPRVCTAGGYGGPSEIPYEYTPHKAQGLRPTPRCPSLDQRGHRVHPTPPLSGPQTGTFQPGLWGGQSQPKETDDPRCQGWPGDGKQRVVGFLHDLPVEFVSGSSFGT